MPITEDFNTFANTYHKNTGGKYLPAPTLCFDIMELVGEQVNIIRKNKEYKKNMSECINTLTTMYNSGGDNFYDYWDEWYRPHTCWLEFLEDNNEEFFVDWKNRIPLESLR